MTKKPQFAMVTGLLLLLTGCSPTALLLEKNPKSGTDFEIKKQQGLVFYKQTEDSSAIAKHDEIQKRFTAHFGKTSELKVIVTKTDQVVKFTNTKDYYFRNKKTNPPVGLLLCNGKDKPQLVKNPARYIEEFEKYFEIPFKDAVYYKERKEKIKQLNKQKAQDILDDKFTMNEKLAAKIQKSPYALYVPKTRFSPKCKNNKIVITVYKDVAKKKKTGIQITELYDQNNQITKYTKMQGKTVKEEINYYRDKFSIVDSIVSIDEKGNKTKEIYKYNKNQFAIISVGKKSISLSAIYYLDSKTSLPTKGERYDSDGEMVGFPKSYKYDDKDRIIEEDEGVYKVVYEYKNPSDLNYSNYKKIENKTVVLENIVTTNKKKQKVETRSEGKTISKTITKTLASKCKETKSEYNNGKLTNFYEYSYQ
ncbi:hypothetical protein NAT51_01665 [Flavobacterium amniphilum]|uniref:hypothetical protein n=1 Tax=Flavobacterium amniphilum TaxID=1834035 RepID=UPI00202A1A8B|nr:hypothetical protein [Flavobacterium amniphilum]MCL9804214.1 hypothetical protein [Flavobacterium amniphilum]